MPALQVQVLPSMSGAVVLALSGHLDLATASILVETVNGIPAASAPPRLILDLTELDFCDSTGVGTLLVASQQVEEAGGRLAMVGVHGRLQRMLQRMGLASMFLIFSTYEQADVFLTIPAAGDESGNSTVP